MQCSMRLTLLQSQTYEQAITREGHVMNINTQNYVHVCHLMFTSRVYTMRPAGPIDFVVSLCDCLLLCLSQSTVHVQLCQCHNHSKGIYM